MHKSQDVEGNIRFIYEYTIAYDICNKKTVIFIKSSPRAFKQ